MTLINTAHTLTQVLNDFDYSIQSVDHLWKIIFLDKNNKWHHMQITKYYSAYYIGIIDDDLPTLEINANKKLELHTFGMSTYGASDKAIHNTWHNLIDQSIKWLKKVKADWIKANKFIQLNYPLNRRTGYVPHSLIRASLPNLYLIDKALGKAKMKKFIQFVESGYFNKDENIVKKTMSAKDFFDYCKIAYIAGQTKEDQIDINLSGREMYKRYADGRDEGLLSIDQNSEKEFADWIDGKHPKKTIGGHPWEIKRGGNTTHIDLFVSRPRFNQNDGFKVTLSGESIGRLKETICMFFAIHDEGLPITIANPENIRKRLLGQDNIGIIPCYESLHRANQLFIEEQSVFDVLHFDDLGRYKSRIKPFITWEPLPILKPAGTF